jgi:hypothetical protein
MKRRSIGYLLWLITCAAILFGGWMAFSRWAGR